MSIFRSISTPRYFAASTFSLDTWLIFRLCHPCGMFRRVKYIQNFLYSRIICLPWTNQTVFRYFLPRHRSVFLDECTVRCHLQMKLTWWGGYWFVIYVYYLMAERALLRTKEMLRRSLIPLYSKDLQAGRWHRRYYEGMWIRTSLYVRNNILNISKMQVKNIIASAKSEY